MWIECWETLPKENKVVRKCKANVYQLCLISGTIDEDSFIHQFSVPCSILILSLKDLDLQLASVYTSMASRDWRRRVEVRNDGPLLQPYLVFLQFYRLSS